MQVSQAKLRLFSSTTGKHPIWSSLGNASHSWLSTRSSCHGLKKSTTYPPASAAPTGSEAPANEQMLPCLQYPILLREQVVLVPRLPTRRRNPTRPTNLPRPYRRQSNTQPQPQKPTTKQETKMNEELHTPTMDRIRDDFIEAWSGHFMDGEEGAAEYFDQALHLHNATIEAAAEQRGAERALREAAKDWRRSAWADAPRNPIQVLAEAYTLYKKHHDGMGLDFNVAIAQVREESEQRGAERAFRKTQEIIARFDHIYREYDDMINTDYLIQEIDTEIQDLMEGDDETH